jgi:hypothetical protein
MDIINIRNYYIANQHFLWYHKAKYKSDTISKINLLRLKQNIILDDNMIVKKELHIDPQPNNWLDKEKKFQKKR